MTTTTVVCMPDDTTIVLNNMYPLSLLENNDDGSSNSGPRPENCNDDGRYRNRLASFKDPWTSAFLTPQQMARAGFHYMGKRDHVRCGHCLVNIENWVPGDDPVTKHKNESPDCPFFKDVVEQEIAAINRNLPNETLRILKKTKIIQEISESFFMDFVSTEARLKSFDDISQAISQSFQSLADAGFFYTGTRDAFQCYACCLGIERWENNDDPWEQHALFSPDCYHLLLMKGHHFIKKVCKEFGSVGQAESLPLENPRGDDSNLEDGDTVAESTDKNLVKPEERDGNHINIAFGENSHLYQERDPETLPPFMLCKICYIKEINVCFLPCGHLFTCVECAITIDQCSMCTLPFDTVLKVALTFNNTEKHDDDDLARLPSGSPKGVEKSCCKRCNKEEMEAVFLPCRHVYACLKCAIDIKECPACYSPICAFIKVYMS